MLAESMDARGHGRGRRTRYRPERWGRQATVVTIASVFAVLVAGAALFSDDPSLAMPAWPITWPEVSPLMLGAIVALSVPAWVSAGDPSRATQ